MDSKSPMNSNNYKYPNTGEKGKSKNVPGKPIKITTSGPNSDSKLIREAKNGIWSIGTKTPNEELAARGQIHRQGLQTTGQPISNPTLLHGIQNAFGITCYLASFLQILATILPDIPEKETSNPIFRAVRDGRLSELKGKGWEALTKEILAYLGLDVKLQHCIDDTLSVFLEKIEDPNHKQTELERQLCKSTSATVFTKYICDSHLCSSRGIEIKKSSRSLVIKGKLPDDDRPVTPDQLLTSYGEWECGVCRKDQATAIESSLKFGTYLLITIARNTGNGTRKGNELVLSPVCRAGVHSVEGLDTIVSLRLKGGVIHSPTEGAKNAEGRGHYTDFELVDEGQFVFKDGTKVAKIPFKFITERSSDIVLLVFEVMPSAVEDFGTSISQVAQRVNGTPKPTMLMHPQRQEMIANHYKSQTTMVKSKGNVSLSPPDHAVAGNPKDVVQETKENPTAKPDKTAPVVFSGKGGTPGKVIKANQETKQRKLSKKQVPKHQLGVGSASARLQMVHGEVPLKVHKTINKRPERTQQTSVAMATVKLTAQSTGKDRNLQDRKRNKGPGDQDGWSIVPGQPPERL